MSLRRRLVALAVLGAVLFAGAVSALIAMSSAIDARLIERGQFEAERALVHPGSEAGEAPFYGECSVGAVVSGSVAMPRAEPPRGLDDSVWSRVRALASAAPGGATATEVLRDGAAPRIMAARARGDGGFAWAMVTVSKPAGLRAWRAVGLFLAAVLLGLVGTAADAVLRLRSAAAALGASVRALSADLLAPVPPAKVRELEDVAGGLRTMASELDAAQREREHLLSALAEERHLAALGRIASALAHEVRNPLAAIKLRVDLARESAGAEATEDLAFVGREIERLDRLVTDLLVVARTRPRAPVRCDLGELAGERATLLDAWAAERGVSFLVRGSAHAVLDVDAVARAIDNLMRNAVEASPNGACVEIEVRDTGDGVELSVTDDGPGVGEAMLPRLFEPFSTTKPKGTGLGLALARAVALAHHGALDYRRTRSDRERTCFTMRLGRGE
jgi:signal transduction histidine kinase